MLAAWSATSAAVSWQARRLPTKLEAGDRLAIGFAISVVGLASLSGLASEAGWSRLLPGLLITGLGTGLVNAALGRLAVASLPHERAAMGSGANNTARYLGGAAGVALAVTIATGRAGGTTTAVLIDGWNAAALVAAAFCAAGAIAALAITRWRMARP